jgi:hypothetical protein
MGMYTGLRAKVKIKPEFRAEITKLHEEGGWENVKVPNIEIWLKQGRNGFIPFGVLAYMPDGFCEPFKPRNTEYGTVEGGSNFDGEWWIFSCSLKNYNGEIQTFIDKILTNIIEQVEYCESLYEEYPWDESTTWRDYTRKHFNE